MSKTTIITPNIPLSSLSITISHNYYAHWTGLKLARDGEEERGEEERGEEERGERRRAGEEERGEEERGRGERRRGGEGERTRGKGGAVHNCVGWSNKEHAFTLCLAIQ